MNLSSRLLASLAVLFADKKTEDKKPDLQELDLFRQGKIAKNRAEQIKSWLVKDTTIYQQWYQLRQEARQSNPVEKTNFLQKVWQKLTAAPLLSPALAGFFVLAIVVSLIGREENTDELLHLARNDIQEWNIRTNANPGFKGGLVRRWKESGPKTNQMKWFQAGLNDHLLKSIPFDQGKIPQCAESDNNCQIKKETFMLLGSWASKADVICRQASRQDQQEINQRLMDWGKSGIVMEEKSLKLAFKQWKSAHYDQVEPCQKVKHLVSIGVNA